MLIWITGLSGSGKTTLGRLVHARLRERAANTVLVDGDDVREVFGLARDEALYTREGRHMVAGRIHDLCRWLDGQDINVVCSTISLFADIHQRNRDAFSRYFEVYIDVPIDILIRRDDKDLYRRAQAGEVRNVVGVDIPFDAPSRPDLLIDNSKDGVDFDALAEDIVTRATAA